MESGISELSWAGTLLQTLMYVVVIGFVVWMVLLLISYLHRRAYNLTVAESANGGKAPDFLDNTGRSDRIREKAKPFDQRMAAERSATTTDRLCGLVRSVTSLAAILTFVVAIIGAVARIQMYDSFVENVSSFEHFINIIKTYWLGATVAGVIILVQLIRVIITIRRNKVASAGF